MQLFVNKNHPACFGKQQVYDNFLVFVNILRKWGFQYVDEFNAEIELKIDFSNERKSKKYGELTADEIIKKINQKFTLSPSLYEMILDWIDGESDFSLDIIVPSIIEENPEYRNKSKEVRSFIDSLLGALIREVDIFGEYCDKTKTITLYSKTIEDQCKDIANIDKHYGIVFAHEMFHAFHYFASNKATIRHINDEIANRRDYTSEVIKESLARYMEELYFRVYNDAPFDYDAFLRASVTYCPYAGANYVYDANFKVIFDLSLDDCDAALRSLLNVSLDKFYEIKNSVTVIKKSEIKQTKVSSASEPFITRHGFPIYITPCDPVVFLDYLNKSHCYTLTVFYNDGTVDSDTCETMVNDLPRLKNNLGTQTLVHDLKRNPRVNDIVFASATIVK